MVHSTAFAKFWKNIIRGSLFPQIFFSLLLLIVILSTWQPTMTPDWDRYESQASSLMRGDGFQTNGMSEARLSPGYPVFVAVWKSFGLDAALIPAAHTIMLLVGLSFVFVTIRPIGAFWSLLVVSAIALNPMVGRSASYFLSEPLGFFLASGVVALLSRITRSTSKPWMCFVIGLLLAALVLTSPALLPLAGLLTIYLVIVLGFIRREVAQCLLLLVGVSVLSVPWQSHCSTVQGSFCPMFYATNTLKFDTSFVPWYRSWAIKQSDLSYWFSPEKIDTAPARAFQSVAEQQTLVNAIRGTSEERERTFAAAADRNILERPWNYYVGLPVTRSFNLWFDMNQVAHVQMSYIMRFSPERILSDINAHGFQRATLRVIKSVLSTLAYAIYLVPVGLIIAAAGLTFRHPKWIPILVLIGIAIYTAVSGFSGLIEARRNIVFLPFIVYLVTYFSSHTSSGREFSAVTAVRKPMESA